MTPPRVWMILAQGAPSDCGGVQYSIADCHGGAATCSACSGLAAADYLGTQPPEEFVDEYRARFRAAAARVGLSATL